MRFLVFSLFLIGSLNLDAQVGNVQVVEDAAVGIAMAHFSEYNKEHNKHLGYRVQLVSTSDQKEAEKVRTKALASYRNYGVDIDWEAPFYKVKVGHFPNRIHAFALMRQMGIAFPSAYLIVDAIDINEFY